GRLEAAMDRLPELTDQEVEELAGLLAQWGSDLGESGERLAFLVTGPVAAEALTQRIEDALGDEQQGVRVLPPAAVRPSPRASLMQMLHQAQGLVAGLLVIGLGGAHLLLDLSVIRQGARTLGRLQPRRPAGRQGTRPLRRWSRGGFAGTWWLAMVWGGSLVPVAATRSGAQLPWGDGKGTFLLGAGLALLAWALAGRINPVRAEEVELAVAAGLTPVQVMEAVILPEARPSLLGLMTRNGRLLEGPGDPRRPFWARLGETIRGRRRIHGDGHGVGAARAWAAPGRGGPAGAGPGQAVRLHRGHPGWRFGGPVRRGGGPPRAQRLRQVDPSAVHCRPGRARPGDGDHRRAGRGRTD